MPGETVGLSRYTRDPDSVPQSMMLTTLNPALPLTVTLITTKV